MPNAHNGLSQVLPQTPKGAHEALAVTPTSLLTKPHGNFLVPAEALGIGVGRKEEPFDLITWLCQAEPVTYMLKIFFFYC